MKCFTPNVVVSNFCSYGNSIANYLLTVNTNVISGVYPATFTRMKIVQSKYWTAECLMEYFIHS